MRRPTKTTPATSHRLRLFRINRLKDGKNISGIGKVIDGVEFENGQVVVCWKSRYSSLGVFRNMEEFIQVHAKPYFKENEFEWVEGFAPDKQVNEACDEIIDYVFRKGSGIKEKAKGDIIAKVIAIKRSNQRAVDPIAYNKRSGDRRLGDDTDMAKNSPEASTEVNSKPTPGDILEGKA